MRHLLLATLSAALLMACSKPAPQQEPVRAVRTVRVEAGATSAGHDYAAEIRARTESRLGFRVGGKMVARSVNVGDTVRAGQVLAQLDPTDLKLGQDAARAAVQAAQTQLDLAEADFKRYKELRDQGFISSAELERRDATVKAARAQWDQARAQASVQTNQAGYAALVADAPGVVVAVDAEPGAVLAAGAPVVRVAQDGPRDAVFSVPEDRVTAIRALQGRKGALLLTMWGSTEPPLAATVREVAAAADPLTRTFLVKADVAGSGLRLGSTGSVSLAALPRNNGIRLPLPALFEQGGQSVVWLLDPASMTVRAQQVVVAGSDGNDVVIAAGLSPGQIVVSAGVHALVPGQKVSLYAEPGNKAAGSSAAIASPATAAASAAASR